MVPLEMFNRRAIALFDDPSDTGRMISRSRSVSTAGTFSTLAPFLSFRDRTSSEGEQRPQPPAIRCLPHGLHQDFGRRVLRNDAASGRS